MSIIKFLNNRNGPHKLYKNSTECDIDCLLDELDCDREKEPKECITAIGAAILAYSNSDCVVDLKSGDEVKVDWYLLAMQ